MTPEGRKSSRTIALLLAYCKNSSAADVSCVLQHLEVRRQPVRPRNVLRSKETCDLSPWHQVGITQGSQHLSRWLAVQMHCAERKLPSRQPSFASNVKTSQFFDAASRLPSISNLPYRCSSCGGRTAVEASTWDSATRASDLMQG